MFVSIYTHTCICIHEYKYIYRQFLHIIGRTLDIIIIKIIPSSPNDPFSHTTSCHIRVTIPLLCNYCVPLDGTRFVAQDRATENCSHTIPLIGEHTNVHTYMYHVHVHGYLSCLSMMSLVTHWWVVVMAEMTCTISIVITVVMSSLLWRLVYWMWPFSSAAEGRRERGGIGGWGRRKERERERNERGRVKRECVWVIPCSAC